MDDKELIKRIMEEVKDEKLREELLALVVEKNRKREEEDPINYLARQEILGGATEGVSKVGWWIMYIVSIVFVLVGLFAFLGFLVYTFEPDAGRPGDNLTALFFSFVFLAMGLGGVFTLRSGKKEYERLKRKRENQGQS